MINGQRWYGREVKYSGTIDEVMVQVKEVAKTLQPIENAPYSYFVEALSRTPAEVEILVRCVDPGGSPHGTTVGSFRLQALLNGSRTRLKVSKRSEWDQELIPAGHDMDGSRLGRYLTNLDTELDRLGFTEERDRRAYGP